MVVHTKYPFFDDGKGLKANPNVSLSLNWNIIPNAGILPRVQSGKTYFKFPNSYA
jgi:signal peptidase complex subunit 3